MQSYASIFVAYIFASGILFPMQDDSIFYDWLKRRCITDTVINDFGLSVGEHPQLGECLHIPIFSSTGEMLYKKYRRNPTVDAKPKYLYDKGGQAQLYGIHKAKDSKRVLITEGEMDSLVAWSCNIPAVSSTGGAMTFLPEWVPFFDGKDVVVCFDNDDAGGKGMVKVLSMIPHARILLLPDRPGVKDISDYVASGGNLEELLRSSKRFSSTQDIIDGRSERLALWQSTWFHDAWVAEKERPVYNNTHIDRDNSSEMARAKSYPIPSIIEIRNKKAICLWHKDTNPSLAYFPNTNTVYCFSCGAYGDSISVYRQKHGCSFKEAVAALTAL